MDCSNPTAICWLTRLCNWREATDCADIVPIALKKIRKVEKRRTCIEDGNRYGSMKEGNYSSPRLSVLKPMGVMFGSGLRKDLR